MQCWDTGHRLHQMDFVKIPDLQRFKFANMTFSESLNFSDSVSSYKIVLIVSASQDSF